MNKSVFFLLAFFSTLPLFAQDVTFGLRGGPSFTTLGGEGSNTEDKFRVGFHVGGYAAFAVSESVGFEAGLQYANKGAKASIAGASTVVRNGYLDLPLLLNYSFGEKFYALAGAQPSFLVSPTLVVEANGDKITVSGDDLGDLYRGFDFAGVIGFGVELSAGMHIQTTYEHGFSNITELPDATYNRGFKLTIGKSF
jgi:hypothetical protein